MELSQQLTVIITSSAIPSNPSTTVLETVLNGFDLVPGLKSCNVILVFDGYLKSVSDQSQYKRMRLCSEDADRYIEYKSQASELTRRFLHIESHIEPNVAHRMSKIGAYQSAEVKSEEYIQIEGPTLTILTLSTRFGFALAVREALYSVTTPYILVHQHDWVFMHELRFEPILSAMLAQPDRLKYIGFYSRQAMKREYRPHLPRSLPIEIEGLRLAPLYFWYDKPHLAAALHYRQFVFGRQRFRVGDFIEDTMGHVMLKDIRDCGPERHLEYGTWVLSCNEPDNRPTLRHVNGRKYSDIIYMRTRKPRRNCSDYPIQQGRGRLEVSWRNWDTIAHRYPERCVELPD